ncbi:hypothetical protein AB0H43_36395 [Hamadaea sp. NPDC050747]|uniref:alpha/beta fold hydrolase n=1 Tax=Hamadaea sp. NPDC050747 TaxID=3155789 RepID=UPI0033F246E8
MANFVLVAGARLGAWAWDDVVPHLRAAGHGVYPVTLSGLAEKRARPAGQQTHVQDIVDEVERWDLRDVVLVGTATRVFRSARPRSGSVLGWPASSSSTPAFPSTVGRSSPVGRTAGPNCRP